MASAEASKQEAEAAASATAVAAAASSVATKRGVRGSLTVPYYYSFSAADGMPLDRLRSTESPTNFGTLCY